MVPIPGPAKKLLLVAMVPLLALALLVSGAQWLWDAGTHANRQPVEGISDPCRNNGTPLRYLRCMEAALDQGVQHLAHGKIAFVSPMTMRQSETKTVEVRIAKTLTQELTEGLTGNGQVKVEEIKVGSLMVVSLHGSAFEITSLTNEAQAVTNDNFTAWEWTVHPLDWGKQTLYLTVCVRLSVSNSKEEQRCSPVYDRAIAVQVDPLYAATHFVKDDPKWTLSTIGSCVVFIGGCFAGIKRWRRKKKETVLNP